jgi:hypothetical protein
MQQLLLPTKEGANGYFVKNLAFRKYFKLFCKPTNPMPVVRVSASALEVDCIMK